MSGEHKFFSKILLFGEYGVICDSMGLSIPFENYRGKWHFEKNKNKLPVVSDLNLLAFWQYMAELEEKGEMLARFDLAQFKKDIDNGLIFQSTIPQGFGIGSSGALCAAFYDQYALDKIDVKDDEQNIIRLKKIFARMESFFHGTSSGLDPLNCYLKKPLLIRNKNLIEFADMHENHDTHQIHAFLINTGNPGKTGPLVNLFFDKCREHHFYKKFRNEFIPLNNECITSFLKGDAHAFFHSVKKLSKFTLKHFEPMIPEPFRPLWKKGLETSLYFLKLCGSGGGGFLLGFTHEPEKAKAHFAAQQIEFISIKE